MLSSIGEAPVPQLEETTVDVSNARQLLQATSRAVQAEGWHFNYEYGLPLVPNIDGEISLPKNTLRVDSIHSSEGLNLVQRGLRLYDMDNHTFKILTTVTVAIVIFLNFTELPEAAKLLITEEAGVRFQASAMGSQLLHAFTKERAEMMRVLLQGADLDTGDYNMLTSNTEFNISQRRRV